MTRDNPPYRDHKARTLPTRAHTARLENALREPRLSVRNHLSSCTRSSEHLLFSKGRRLQNARETRQLGYADGISRRNECGRKIFPCRTARVYARAGKKGGNCISLLAATVGYRFWWAALFRSSDVAAPCNPRILKTTRYTAWTLRLALRHGKFFRLRHTAENQQKFGIENAELLPTISRRRDIFRRGSFVN